MNTNSNADAGKNILWPGATHILARASAKIPSGFGGRSRPRCLRPCGRTSKPSRVRILANSCPSKTDAAHMRNAGPTKEKPCLY